MSRATGRRVWGLALGLALAGCGGTALVPVEGRVVWEDGTPADLAGYQVESSVPDSKVSSRGDIGPDGRFKLGTHTADDGVEPGTHTATISPIPRDENEPRPKTKLPARYAKGKTSGLTFAAEAGKANVVTLTVGRK